MISDAAQIIESKPILPSQRMEMLDVGRFIAAVGVIILHVAAIEAETAYIGWLGRFAVPFFTTTAVALAVDGFRRNPAKLLGAYGASRLLRIYVPFLVWTLAYVALRNFKYRFLSHQPLIRLEWFVLIVGSAHHLWFLPFILLATLFAAAGAKLVLFRLPAWAVVSISVGSALIPMLFHSQVKPVPPGGDGAGLTIHYFMGLAWQTLPMALMGVGVGRVLQELRSLRHRATVACFGVTLGVLSLALGPAFNYALALQYASGIGIVFFALGPWHNSLVRAVASWGQAAYGIYLVHVFWYLSLDLLLSKLHLTRGLGTIWMIIASTTVLSTLSAVLISKSRFTAWTIGIGAPSRGLCR